VTELCGLGEDVEVDVFREERLFVVGVRHRQASCTRVPGTTPHPPKTPNQKISILSKYL
jgi:hypothetical protein